MIRYFRKLRRDYARWQYHRTLERLSPGAGKRRVERAILSEQARRGWKTRRAG